MWPHKHTQAGLQSPTHGNQNLKHQTGKVLKNSYKTHFWPFFSSTCQRMIPGRMTLIHFKPSPLLQVGLSGSHLDYGSYWLLIQLVLLWQYLKCYNKTTFYCHGCLKCYGRKETKPLESHCVSFTTKCSRWHSEWYSNNPDKLELGLTESNRTVPEHSYKHLNAKTAAPQTGGPLFTLTHFIKLLPWGLVF